MEGQLEIDFTRHARSGDPTTSHEAAEKWNKKRVTEGMHRILKTLLPGPLNGEKLLMQSNVEGLKLLTSSGYRTTRKTLERAGLIEDLGVSPEKTQAGRDCLLWQLTDKGRWIAENDCVGLSIKDADDGRPSRVKPMVLGDKGHNEGQRLLI